MGCNAQESPTRTLHRDHGYTVRGAPNCPLMVDFLLKCFSCCLPSLKLTAKAPENGWLEYDPASFWGVNFGLFSGANLLLVLGSVKDDLTQFLKD